MKFALFTQLATLAVKIPPFVLHIGKDVAEAAGDGSITPDEAEQVARDASAEAGDLLKINVKGVDVVDAQAQSDLAGFVGRVTAKIVTALA